MADDSKNPLVRATKSIPALIATLILVAFIIFLLYVIVSNPTVWGWITSASASSVDTATTTFDATYGGFFSFFDYIFGPIPQFLSEVTTNNYSPMIVVIAIWLLLFVTFGDILETFSTFSKEVAWLSAFLISIIAANLNAVVTITAFFVGLLSVLGSFMVFGGMLAAFVAFFAVNTGIRWFAPWLMQRRAMMKADEYARNAKVGANEVSSTITGLRDIGESLSKKR